MLIVIFNQIHKNKINWIIIFIIFYFLEFSIFFFFIFFFNCLFNMSDDYDFELDFDMDDKKKRSIPLGIGLIAGAVIVVVCIIVGFSAGLTIGIVTCDDSGDDTVVGNTTVPTNTPSPSASPSLEFWENISLDGMMTHLSALQQIANDNGGTRSISSPGYQASLEYVQDLLTQQTNYLLEVQPFSVNITKQLADPIFEMESPSYQEYQTPLEYSPMQYSGSGNVTSESIGIPNLGCNFDDFNTFESGKIALISRGNCTFQLKTENAVNAGAIGVLIYNYMDQTSSVQGTLGEPFDIPVFGLTYSLGQQLLYSPSSVLHMNYSSETSTIVTANLIAETQGGNSDSIVIVGSHLDSVDAGPGINDNGSGSSANLQMALQFLSEVEFVNKVRFIWYGAEEEGLLGSTFYVENLTQNEKDNIALNLNFDMLGSPNYIRGVLNGTDSTIPGSAVIMNTFIEYFNQVDLTYDIIPFTGRSDYGPYLDAGIAAGGIETGAELIKDEDGRKKFGGMANTPYDPCYHQACDTIENVNTEVLLQTAQGAAYALQKFATQSDLNSYLNNGNNDNNNNVKHVESSTYESNFQTFKTIQ